MDEAIKDILEHLRGGEELDARALDRLVRAHSKRLHDSRRVIAKKNLLPRYLYVKANEPALFGSWDVDEELDARFVATLKMKPRRTASGVATITVITKPWTCANDCIYCPCDVRMPKSYLHDEPACQRAERNYFDPYLQVAARLQALEHMGHATDKVELIVLGGSWTDYPRPYRLWFVGELFAALNDVKDDRAKKRMHRSAWYEQAGISCDPDTLHRRCASLQKDVHEGRLPFNAAIARLYRDDSGWAQASMRHSATIEDVREQHVRNERAEHRVVGLVVETRPDAVTPAVLTELRQLGATKLQLGIQSLRADILAQNGRSSSSAACVANALQLCRLFGFKTHVHFMLNLLGSTPDDDIADYQTLVTDEAFCPDEVKLYPCALVGGTKLAERYREGLWRPYTEDELVRVLSHDMMQTPPYMRVSRMIRDISAKDILVGNKKTNLRQLVEKKLAYDQAPVSEIRFREIGVDGVDLSMLLLDEVAYRTSATEERFLQWITPEGRIAGFLRLSLPSADIIARNERILPVKTGEAMIREVHVYGFAAKIDGQAATAQHHGLGKTLVQQACERAAAAGYERINVISAVGTRPYYRKLGFKDNGLYLTRELQPRS